MWEKFRTSKERLEQCGWKFVRQSAMASRFSMKVFNVNVCIGVSPETYELYYITVSSENMIYSPNDGDPCTVLSVPELLQLTEKIKELEVK